MSRRGSYAKGIAKREEILRAALDVIAEQGVNGASVKELAAAVGLSQNGILHYFDSKDELFLEILRTRDSADLLSFLPEHSLEGKDGVDAGGEPPERALAAFLDVVRHNASVPGLIALFSRMSAEAADPASPAHAFFARRSQELREGLTAVFADLQDQGRLDPQADPVALARGLQAASDGLQLQALVEPDLDMAGAIAELLHVLVPGLVVPGWERPAEVRPS